MKKLLLKNSSLLNLLFTLIIFIFSSISLRAQNAKLDSLSKLDRKIKVGVVLSGGGAKGVAHVGVLRMIEEAGIHIDYIGGASMGAIVSSLYAIGYSVDDLDSIIRGMDMSKMVEGNIPRENRPYFKKKYDDHYIGQLPLVDWELGLPQGLSNGQDVINEFNNLTRGYHGYQDFSKFPTPLVIMCTDLVSGESLEFHEGDLPLTMRASSSFPSLFAPVEVDGRLLVDGGVTNNFPVQEVIDMGADIIIGVSVEDGLYKKNELTSINRILEQLSSFKMVEKSQEQTKKVDIFLKPNVKGYSVVSFDKADEILELGETEGFKFFNEFLKIAELQKNSRREKSDIEYRKHSYKISSFSVEGSESHHEAYFEDRFKDDLVGRTVEMDELKYALKNIEGTDNFEMISYQLIDDDNGESKLHLIVKEKPVKNFIKLGIHYDHLYDASALLNLTMNNTWLKSSILSLDVAVSDKPRVFFRYYKDNAKWPGFLIESNYQQFLAPVPTKTLETGGVLFQTNYIDIRAKDWTTSLTAQLTINENYAIGIGGEVKSIDVYTNSIKVQDTITGDILDKPYVLDRSWMFIPKVQIFADTKDDVDFPTKGIEFLAEYKLIKPWSGSGELEDHTYELTTFFNSRIDYTFSLNRSIAWTNILSASARIGQLPSSGLQYFFGGYNKNLFNNYYSFFGYELFGIEGGEEFGFMKFHTKFQFQLRNSLFLTVHANYLNTSNENGEWYQPTRIDYSGYALSLGYKSIIGPIELTGDYSPEIGKFHLLFNLGFWF